MSDGQIQNLVGAVSFTNAIKDSVEQEAEHARAAIDRMTTASGQLVILNQYMTSLAGLKEMNGLSSDRQRQACAQMVATARSVDSVKKPIEELVGYFEKINEFVGDIQDRLNAMMEQ